MNNYRNEINNVDGNASDGKSFKYKTKIIGKTEAGPARTTQPDPDRDGNQPSRPYQQSVPPLNTEATIPLKYLSNFWRSLDLALINCKLELDLKWSRNCVLIEDYGPIIGIIFIITITKLYVPLVTSSINDNVKFLENIKQGFKRTTSWNKYRSEIITRPKNNNLDYLIDPKYNININRLFFPSFKYGNMVLRETLLINITCH